MKYKFKCKECGAEYELVLKADEPFIKCGACGELNDRLRATEKESLENLGRAAILRENCDFYEAEKLYDAVLLTCKEEHSALWGKLMCQYGVEIIEDPKTRRQYQVLHFAYKGKPLQEQGDFRKACELAPEDVRKDYAEKAAYLDEVQAEIIRLAEQMEPYDVFICHKATELDSDEKTDDYDRAEDLYKWLGTLGYRAFFAPVEIQRVSAGADYEAAIFNALHTAKVMLVVCSRGDYLNSTWVQSEYRRYLEVMDANKADTGEMDRCLLPLLYGGMPGAKLPVPFRVRNIQGVMMEEPEAEGIVLEKVKKYCGAREKAAPAPVQPEPEMSPFRAETVWDDDFVTKPCAGGLCIAKYIGQGGSVVIPGLLNGQIVVAIGDGAFENCSTLEEITVSHAVMSIGIKAFHGCKKLKQVTLLSGLTEIGNMAFNGCVSLTEIRLPEGLSAVAQYTFYGCSALQTVELPEGLQTIGVGAFHGCESLQKMDIPQSVKEIGRTAFGECRSLHELTLPEGLQKIERGAFAGCSGLLLKVYEDSVAHAFVQKYALSHKCLCSYSPADFAIKPCEDGCSIVEYTGPGGRVVIPPVIRGMPVTEIGRSAFEGCETLTDVVIPQSVRRLLSRCFRVCEGLTRICIPEGVTCISDGILDGCYKLTDVNVPASVKEIRGNPFPRCAALQAIRVAADNPKYVQCDGVLMSRRGDLICYPAGRQEEYYKVPGNVEYIGVSAFLGCSEMLSVFIPQDVEMDTEAFERFRCPMLYVYEGSLAHECAQETGLRFDLIEQEKGFRPAPATDPAILTITFPTCFVWTFRKVVIRIDGRDEYQLGNGESVRVELAAGQHSVDLKRKPSAGGSVNWNSGNCQRNIFREQMTAGQNYTLDLSEWMEKLTE